MAQELIIRKGELLVEKPMRCPFFEEMVVAFCRAYPVKKMVPSDRLQANCICTCEAFGDCPLFQEVMAKVERTKAGAPEAEAEKNTPEPS
jgi:hypothetical protein